MTRTADAFGQVQGALSWFINAYTDLADWKASVDRLIGFEQDMSKAVASPTDSSIRLADGADAGPVPTLLVAVTVNV